MKKILMTAMLLPLLTACSLTAELSNRLACTVAKDEVFVVSQYGPVGLASKIDEKDRKEVCK